MWTASAIKELPGYLDKKQRRSSVLQTLKEKCDAPECNPIVCRKAMDEHELYHEELS